jgi:arabinofuranosyltransferase
MKPAQGTPLRSFALAVPILLVLFLLMQVLLGAGLVDDTYIFLRYARNFADGNGLVFNPGERVEGYTSPLWTFLLAVPAALGIDLELSAAMLSAAFGFGTVLLLMWTAHKWIAPRYSLLALLAPLALVSNPAFHYWIWSGMDTAIFSFLFLLAFHLFVSRRSSGFRGCLLPGAVFALAALARLEMLVLVPVYLVALLWRERRGSLPGLLGLTLPLVILLPHALWRYSYYGAWLPNTLDAKAGVPTVTLLPGGLSYLVNFLLTHILYLCLVLVGLILVKRSGNSILEREAVALGIIAVWLSYVPTVGGDHFALFRFFVPAIPLLVLLSLAAAGRLLSSIRTEGQRYGVLVPAAIAIIVMSGVLIYASGGDRAKGEVELARQWGIVGRWLALNLPPDSTLASMVVGAIPYHSGFVTYDLLGLTDREVARRGRVYEQAVVGHQKYNTDYILSREPTFIIHPASGLYEDPSDPFARDLNRRYYFSFYDLVNNPQTQDLYELRNIELDNGRYLQLWQRRSGE